GTASPRSMAQLSQAMPGKRILLKAQLGNVRSRSGLIRFAMVTDRIPLVKHGDAIAVGHRRLQRP
ncbi:MAG: hypothetical protein AAFU53_08800, partial [Cyanobacteria bacterium J06632_3]